jgi:glycosyltransferase involved in cell wall biosynthesis
MPRLSVIVITRDEAANIRDCLASVRFADEIVVVDSGSTDGTPELCRGLADRIVVTDWPGFGPQKQRALELATGEWVLSIDADERVDAALRAEILAALGRGGVAGFYLPRLSFVCGTPVRHGGWYPDYVLRLFRREAGRFSPDVVHEKVLVTGATARLATPLLHYSYVSLEQLVDKLNLYSTLGADKLRARGQRGGLGAAIGHGLAAFLRSYVAKAGFLDGRTGFIVAVSSAESAYYKYLKLALGRAR